MKIDQIIGYFNQRKINLTPPFPRGTVWALKLRQWLLDALLQLPQAGESANRLSAVFTTFSDKPSEGGGFRGQGWR